MHDLIQVYHCSICGDVTDVEPVEIIDTERDDVWTEMMDSKGHSVIPKLIEGVPCYERRSDIQRLSLTGE